MTEVARDGGIITWMLYDAVIPSTTSSYQFFTVPIGQGSKTLFHTNMRQSGQLPEPQEFWIHGLGWGALGDNIFADVNKMQNGYFKLVINDKTWLEAPLLFLGSGFGTRIIPDSGSTGTDVYAQNGAPEDSSIFKMIDPLHIDMGRNFYVEVTWNAALTDAKIFWFVLYGQLKRAVN